MPLTELLSTPMGCISIILYIPQVGPMSMETPTQQPTFFTSLVAGGIAGLSVDVSLYPLDTLKTRLQSADGFFKAGGFRGIYNGLTAAAAGSVPGAALFFSTYETMKPAIWNTFGDSPITPMLASSCGEVMACLVRVPTENVKQKMQAGMYKSTSEAMQGVLKQQGFTGFFTGYFTTVMREVPFAFIQFPIYERAKVEWAKAQGHPCSPMQGAACGSGAGAIAAAVTTPLDVIKTRLMLGADSKGVAYTGPVETAARIYADEGAAKFFSGVSPRVFWITLGGFVFFGAYEQSKLKLMEYQEE